MKVDAGVLLHQVPGGMISNLVSQLREQGAVDKLRDVLDEIPAVRADLGYPPLVTPTSQIVGTQAVLNALYGERYKQVTQGDARRSSSASTARRRRPSAPERPRENRSRREADHRPPGRRPRTRAGEGAQGDRRPRARGRGRALLRALPAGRKRVPRVAGGRRRAGERGGRGDRRRPRPGTARCAAGCGERPRSRSRSLEDGGSPAIVEGAIDEARNRRP